MNKEFLKRQYGTLSRVELLNTIEGFRQMHKRFPERYGVQLSTARELLNSKGI